MTLLLRAATVLSLILSFGATVGCQKKLVQPEVQPEPPMTAAPPPAPKPEAKYEPAVAEPAPKPVPEVLPAPPPPPPPAVAAPIVTTHIRVGNIFEYERRVENTAAPSSQKSTPQAAVAAVAPSQSCIASVIDTTKTSCLDIYKQVLGLFSALLIAWLSKKLGVVDFIAKKKKETPKNGENGG